MLVGFGRASLFQKARSNPERVKQAIAKIRTDGLIPTIEAVFRRLDEPLPLGYCNAGEIIAIGPGVTGFGIGDRVASNGPHAEIVAVPANLAARIPDGVADDAAAFTVIGAIGLQGVRLARPEFGETFVVIGLGLIGQLVAQFLRGAGCRVIGFDVDRDKVNVARARGIQAVGVDGELDAVKYALAATEGMGVDGVLITASTSSHEVISQSARMSRKRGRIVLIGVVGLNLNRAEFYHKELSFQVSCSYGPGRYEDAYEEKGFDYPPGFVRWTENRNFQAVLAALDTGILQVTPLVSKRVPFGRFAEIYDEIDGGDLASLLQYDPGKALQQRAINLEGGQFDAATGSLAVVGAGNFSKMTVLPALTAAKISVRAIVSAKGLSATHLARKFKVPVSSTDMAAILNDPKVKGVIIATRHDLHASIILEALRAGKHILVEKPLCISPEELRLIEEAIGRRRHAPSSAVSQGQPEFLPIVTVGYNRRFSRHTEKMKFLLGPDSGAISIVMTINAGPVPQDSWLHDPTVGGGRLLGEACHFVDLAIHLSGSMVAEVCALGLNGDPSPVTDVASILLHHENGSIAVINYFSNGHREVSKERVELHSQGRSLVLDNFRTLRGFGFREFRSLKTRLDKGHAREFALFSERINSGGPPLIPWNEIANSTRATFAALKSLRTRAWVRVDDI